VKAAIMAAFEEPFPVVRLLWSILAVDWEAIKTGLAYYDTNVEGVAGCNLARVRV
jgi:hypothetical protein